MSAQAPCAFQHHWCDEPWVDHMENLFSHLIIVWQFHLPVEVPFRDVVQNLDSDVEEVFKMHVAQFALQAKPADDLISEVGAFGNSLKIVTQSIIEVCFSDASITLTLGSTQVLFCDSNAL